MATNQTEMGDSCRSAVMAALEVIEDECGDGRRAVEMDDGVVALMPAPARELRKNVDVDNASPQEVDRLLGQSEWLDNWTESMCRNAGIPEESQEFQKCRRNFTRKALRS